MADEILLRNAYIITANDGADLPNLITGISIAVAGVVRVTVFGNGAAIDVALSAGIIHRLHIVKVHATGTGAVGTIVGYY